MWLTMLPFTLVGLDGWATVPHCLLIAFLLLGELTECVVERAVWVGRMDMPDADRACIARLVLLF